MRHQDKYLTRQFIQLRATIQRIKSENSLLEGMEGSSDRMKEPSFRHSIPGPTLRPTFGRSISYLWHRAHSFASDLFDEQSCVMF